MNYRIFTIFILLSFLLTACGDDKKKADTTPFTGQVFKLLTSNETNVSFEPWRTSLDKNAGALHVVCGAITKQGMLFFCTKAWATLHNSC